MKQIHKRLAAYLLSMILVLGMLSPLSLQAMEAGVSTETSPQPAATTEGALTVTSAAITIALQATGLQGELFKSEDLTIPAGEVEEDGHILDRHSALGALAYYCQENGIPLTVAESAWGIYVQQIGEDPADEYGWMYYLNGESPWVGAAEQMLADGNVLHFGNWQLTLYLTIDLNATGMEGDLFREKGVTIPAGEVEEDGHTLDRHSALGALAHYCQENGIPLTVTESVWGIYVQQIGEDPADEKNWTYYVNGESPWVGAAEQMLAEGDILHFGNWNLDLYTPEEVRFEAAEGGWIQAEGTVLDALLRFQQPDGSFWWTQEIEGMPKFSVVQVLGALVDLGHGGSHKHQPGTPVDLEGAPGRLREALALTVGWYRENHNPASSWEGLTALRAAGQDLNAAPWGTDQSFRTTDPGFEADATGTEHIQAIFQLRSVGMDPAAAWGRRNLYGELAAQQDPSTGAIGAYLGKHIWAMVALDAQEGWDRTKAVSHLLASQHADGYFEDLDTTGWALTALAPYRGTGTVDEAVAKAVDFLAGRQKVNGGFEPLPASWGAMPENSNTNASVIAGLAAVGESLLPEQNEVAVTALDIPMEITLSTGVAATVLVTQPLEEGGKKTAMLPQIQVTAHTGEGSTQLEIPKGTKVTGSSQWDGRIQLPLMLDPATVPFGEGTLASAVEVGHPGGSLSFDRPVRLLLPGQAGKSAGFLQSGIFTEITRVLEGDSGAGLEGGESGKIAVGQDLVVWTTHFTTFIAYEAPADTTDDTNLDESPNDTGSTGGGTTSGGSQASLTVRGLGGKTILSATQHTVEAGETVLSFTEKVLADRGIPYQVQGGYVRSIDGLAEFDHGPESGWMFSVNTAYPQTGASATRVRSGDSIRWSYTADLGVDLGATSKVTATEETAAGLALEEVRKGAVAWILANRDFRIHDNFADWDALALARSKETVPAAYGTALQALLEETGGDFRLVTDQARILLAATALGQDPQDLFGHDLLAKTLANGNMLLQGVNGPIHALLALDSGTFAEPAGALWTREKLLGEILKAQKTAGGWALDQDPAAPGDIDLTAMALTALAPYRDQEAVDRATEEALAWLDLQTFGNSESAAQTILALTTLGQDPSEMDLLTILLAYRQEDGGFAHGGDGGSDPIATQQALMALEAYRRFQEGEPAFYHMADAAADPLLAIRFADGDQVSPWAMEAMKKAVAYGLMDGVSQEELRMAPKRTLTRAEYATLLARMYGLEPLESAAPAFGDVTPGDWHYGWVMTARDQGFMQGVGQDRFEPQRAITRQEMAVVLENALGLEALESPEAMAAPTDIAEAADWARTSVQLAYHHGLMLGDGQRFEPAGALTREMAAVVLVRVYENHLEGGADIHAETEN
ncbi:DUF4430 domain-containing protein [Anaerotalea alkaliphila]|uniref:DUF4430 domain-containing protein n=1 Tax=Anaerotalea alkaliphila TaxID=2662126 RepID=A0A7X5HV16_9FIRM|nr:DUF4430 domain-containing protein [Anaerotalea alkaliphila]NDL67182.1 DUF4430 domain-containing protein [Anaerotalea alkaliphila]